MKARYARKLFKEGCKMANYTSEELGRLNANDAAKIISWVLGAKYKKLKSLIALGEKKNGIAK